MQIIDYHNKNTQKIAKNTVFLYLRMFLMMLIGLYTSRVVLNTLGFDDYGISNAVGGIVILFSVLTGTLSSAISRFITYELGTGDYEKLKTVFSTSIFVQFTLAVIIMILCEVIGYWLLMNKMSIPEGRMDAALWVFHFSIIGFGLSLIFTPFNSLIIAHERMDAFAYVSLLEAVAKLLIVYILLLFNIDKLKLYTVLLFGITLLIGSIYISYCRRHFEESKLVWRFDKTIFKHIASFAGWNLFGHGAWMLETQGTNLLINIFFGVQLNAARGIAVQVDNLVRQFVSNFMMALTPQITKSYAAGDFAYMHDIVLKGSKFSYFLLLMVAIPFLSETHMILDLWFVKYPLFSIPFVRCSIIISLFMVLTDPYLTALRASGLIKNYQILIGCVGILQFPLIYLSFKYGFSPIYAYFIPMAFHAFFVFFKPYLVNHYIKVSLKKFFSEVVIPAIYVTLLCSVFPVFFCFFIDVSLFRLFMNSIVATFMSLLIIWSIGLNKDERLFVKSFLIKKLFKARIKNG